MRWYIKVNRRLVYLVPKDQDNLDYKQLVAPLPPHPINKCKVDISVLVLLTIEIFLYHLPVWRQQQRLRQYGINLPDSTLCYFVSLITRLVNHVRKICIGRYAIMRTADLLQQQADETLLAIANYNSYLRWRTILLG